MNKVHLFIFLCGRQIKKYCSQDKHFACKGQEDTTIYFSCALCDKFLIKTLSLFVPLIFQAHAMHCIHSFLDIRPGPNTTVLLEIIHCNLKDSSCFALRKTCLSKCTPKSQLVDT